jgi:hypothetical protein
MSKVIDPLKEIWRKAKAARVSAVKILQWHEIVDPAAGEDRNLLKLKFVLLLWSSNL